MEGRRLMLVNSGRDLQAQAMGGDLTAFVGTATATSATSLTVASGFTASAYIGKIVVAGTTPGTAVYGIITANSTTVLTIDRWYNPLTPGGAAATPPSATTTFIIMPGGAPVGYMGLTANATAASGTDTTLATGGGAEIVTAGLLRKIATYAHTAGVASYTLTAVYTAQAGDVPVTVAKMGTFNSLTGGIMAFETLLNATATLSLAGDQLTVTDTVTTS
jgi:hypothetical protein